MARRDVELAIRVRDEISSGLTAITRALETVRNEISATGRESVESSSDLGRFGSAYKELRTTLGGLATDGGAVKGIQQINAELGKQAGRLNETIREVKDLRREYRQLDRTTGELSAKKALLTERQEKANSVLTRYQKLVKDTRAESEKAGGVAEKEAAALAARGRLAEAQIEHQRRELGVHRELRAEINKIQQELSVTGERNERLEQRQRELNEELFRSTRAVEEAYNEYRKLNIELGELPPELQNISQRLEKYESTVASAEKLSSQYADELDRVQKSLKIAAGRQRELNREISKGAARQNSQRRDLTDTLRTRDRALEDAREIDRLTEQLDKRTRSGLLPALREQQRRVAETREQYRLLQEQLNGVARQYRAAEEPSRALSNSFQQGVNTARAAKTELQAQEAALRSLSNTIVRSSSSVEGIDANTMEFNSTLQRARTGYAELEKAIDSNAQSLRVLNQEREKENAFMRIARLEARRYRTEQALGAHGLSEEDRASRRQLLPGISSRIVDEQRQALESLEQQYRQMRRSATELGREFSNTKGPSETLTRSFRDASAATRELKAQVLSQRAAFQSLNQTLTGPVGPLENLAGRAERADAALDQLREGTARADKVFDSASESVSRFARETGRAELNAERYANRITRAGNASATAAKQKNLFAEAVRQFYGDTRRALSFTQRLRGEVLSLIAAYGGFFAIIGAVRQVIETTRQLESASNRLLVVARGDLTVAAESMDFVRRTAQRLGIQFGVLATEYSKFAIATEGTVLAGDRTRKIFTSIAEAARVNNLDLNQMRGVFVALTQIVSKGAVSMEELRQQLGDRLPGAIQIMADAVGLSVAEMVKLISRGQLSSDVLAQFADELDERFGSQLPTALDNTATALGRLQNAVFLAFTRVGEQGAGRGFTDLLNTITETLNTPEFLTFLDRMGEGLSVLASLLSLAVRNWDLLLFTLIAFASYRFAPLIFAIAESMQALTQWVRRTAAATVVLAQRFQLAAARGIRLRYVNLRLIRSLRALRALLLTRGGIAGLLIFGAALLTEWLVSSTDLNEVLVETEKIVGRIKNAYDAVGDSVSKIRKELEDTTEVETQNLLAQAREAQREAFRSLQGELITGAPATGFETPAEARFITFSNELGPLLEQFRDGTLDARDFNKEIDKLAKSLIATDPEFRTLFNTLANHLGDVRDTTKAVQDLENVLKLLFSEDDATAREGLAGLSPVAEDAESRAERAAEAAGRFQSALDSLTESQKDAPDSILPRRYEKQLNGLRDNALKAAEGLDTMLERIQAISKVNIEFSRLLNIAELQALAENNSAGFFLRATNQSPQNQQELKLLTEIRDGIEDDLRRRAGPLGFDNFSSAERNILIALASSFRDVPAVMERLLEVIRSGDSQELIRFLNNVQTSGLPPGQSGQGRGISAADRDALLAVAARFAGTGGGGPEAQRKQDAKIAQEQGELLEAEIKSIEELRETASELIQAMRDQVAEMQGDLLEREVEAINQQTEAAKALTEAIREQVGEEQAAALEAEIQAIEEQNKSAQELTDAIKALIGEEQATALQAEIDSINELNRTAQEQTEAIKAQELDEQIALLQAEIDSIDALNEAAREQTEAIREQELDEQIKVLQDEIDAIEKLTEEAKALTQAIHDLAAEQQGESLQDEVDALQAFEERQQATQDRINGLRESIRLRKLEIEQGEIILAGEEAVLEARKENKDILGTQENLIRSLAQELAELNAEAEDFPGKDIADKIQEAIDKLTEYRDTLQELRDAKAASGDATPAELEGLDLQVEAANQALKEGIDSALVQLSAYEGQNDELDLIIAKLRVARQEAENYGNEVLLTYGELSNIIADSASSAIGTFIDELADGEKRIKALQRAFLDFAASFLKELAQMIIQQQILNALQTVGGFLGLTEGTQVLHGGGIAGGTGPRRRISPSVFIGAQRFHNGGVPGLRSNEIPAILKRGEEILPENDPRHVNNYKGNGGEGGRMPVTVVNALEGDRIAEEIVKNRRGRQIIVNLIKGNQRATERI